MSTICAQTRGLSHSKVSLVLLLVGVAPQGGNACLSTAYCVASTTSSAYCLVLVLFAAI